MNPRPLFDPKLDFAIERFIDAPPRLVWEALTRPEHLKETALHRNEADLENNKVSGFYQGTEIAIDQFVAHVLAMK